jgi:multisubunit Na+/H+ antiporter MnhB subunit
VLWILAVGYQVVSWWRAAGGRRQQLNWLMAGGAVALVSFLAAIAANAPLLLPHSVRLAIGEVLLAGVAALPAAWGWRS